MPQLSRILRPFAIFAFLTCLFPLSARAGTWVAFQNSYTRGTGAPVTMTSTFTLLNPNTQYTLKAFNGGLQNDTTELVSNSVVYLNGAQVVGPTNFNQSVAEVNVTIFPGLSNTLSVQVRGKPGGLLTIQVIGVDNDPPTITASLNPAPNAVGWNNSPVTVTFTCSDKTSGVASCPQPVTVSTEGANHVVSGTATDLAGNTASTSVTVNLDMTPPTISGSINPPPDAGGYNSGPVTVTFTCADAISGVATCSPAVTFTNEGPNQTATGTAVDVAGNTSTATVTVNISFNYFKIRSWQTNPAGDPSLTGKCLDYGAGIFLNDCSAAHPIRVVELAPNCNSPRIGSHGTPLCYEVMLFVGNSVIGVHNPGNPIIGTAPPPPPTELQLELQAPYNSQAGTGIFTATQQVFRLDGDSIILESSHLELETNTVLPTFVEVPGPCISTVASTTPCPSPPPQLVIQVQNARGVNGSPLVAAGRNLADNEFWDFVPLVGSRPYATTGVQSVASPDALWNAICTNQTTIVTSGDLTLQIPPTTPCSPPNALWGTVILISSPTHCAAVPGPFPGQTQDIGGCVDLSPYLPISLPAGVTIRGNRRGTNFGPQLYESTSSSASSALIFDVEGDYARVTGLRLRGQSRSTDSKQLGGGAIRVGFPGPAAAPLFPLTTTTQFIATIDHNDVSDWTSTAIDALGPYRNNSDGSCTYPPPANTQNPCTDLITFTDPTSGALVRVAVADDPSTLANVHVARNFIHHNQEQSNGYGAATSGGGRAFIEGNLFDWNRHDIASDAEPHDEYRAASNLVLSGQSTGDQNFDMHGSGCPDFFGEKHCGYGGTAGFYVDIVGNTFLATNRQNYWLRGQPVINTAFHNNVSLRNAGDAIAFHTCYPILCIEGSEPINVFDNQFADSSPPYTDPTTRLGPASLGVGDFDGDGDDDLFLTTGASWYYSPAGSRDWRFLSAKVDRIDSLLLGDFDGDGRTDVVGMNPSGQFDVSWGGVSDWEVINQSPCANGVPNPCPTSIQNMVVGDFDGDGKPDILYTDKVHWYISYGGTMPFAQVNDSSFLVQDLRFGHFAICGSGAEADVFSVQNTGWYVSCGATTPWQFLGVALTKTVLVVADFNGDGIADVLAPSSDGWQISYGGSQPLTNVPQLFGSFTFVAVAGVGHFTGQPQTDVLMWNGLGSGPIVTGTELLLSAAAVSPATQYSTQDMR